MSSFADPVPVRRTGARYPDVPSFLGAGIRDVECRATPGADAGDWGIPLPPELHQAVAKRQWEYRAGRHCARQALERLGADAVVPGRDPSGAPVWPDAVVGAITHTAGYARAAVGWVRDFAGVGIDTEGVVPPARLKLGPSIAVPPEFAVAEAGGLDACEAFTLVFSAKEAVYKCLHPLVRRHFGFHDVRLTALDAATAGFTVELVTTLTPEWQSGTTLAGRFALDGSLLHTGVTVPAGLIGVVS